MIFITFVIVYFLKILIVLIIGIYIDNATYYISTDLREKVIRGLKQHHGLTLNQKNKD